MSNISYFDNKRKRITIRLQKEYENAKIMKATNQKITQTHFNIFLCASSFKKDVISSSNVAF